MHDHYYGNTHEMVHNNDWFVVVSTPLKNMNVSCDDYAQY